MKVNTSSNKRCYRWAKTGIVDLALFLRILLSLRAIIIYFLTRNAILQFIWVIFALFEIFCRRCWAKTSKTNLRIELTLIFKSDLHLSNFTLIKAIAFSKQENDFRTSYFSYRLVTKFNLASLNFLWAMICLSFCKKIYFDFVSFLCLHFRSFLVCSANTLHSYSTLTTSM